jgi:hypothetical protein
VGEAVRKGEFYFVRTHRGPDSFIHLLNRLTKSEYTKASMVRQALPRRSLSSTTVIQPSRMTHNSDL